MQSTQRPFEDLRDTLLHTMRRILDQFEPEQPKPCPPGRPVITFMPGHIGVVAAFPPTLSDLDEKTAIRRIQSALSRIQLNEDIIWTTERVTILRGRGQNLAVAFGDVPAARKNPARLLRLITQINNETLPPPQPDDQPPSNPDDPSKSSGGNDQTSSARTPQFAARFAASGPSSPPPTGGLKPDAQGFQVIAASPNWLGGGATQNSVGGGPGAPPIAVPAPSISNTGIKPWEWDVPQELPTPNPIDDTVEVAILDTAPARPYLQAAHTALVQNQAQPHELLAQLLGGPGNFDIDGNGRLHMVYAATDLMGRVDASLYANSYHMPDHGLFISGIISSLAPNAKLHLIEVLNEYGVGTLETLAEGFGRVIDIRTTMPFDKPLVVNCSLVLNIPQSVTQLTQQQLLAEDIAGLTPQEALQMAQMLGYICQLVSPTTSKSTMLVAAAGNDSTMTGSDGSVGHRELARFPAAYGNVTGVAALQRDDNPTPYSNIADDPMMIGYATFGGEIAVPSPTETPPPPPATDAVNGVLGVFVGAIGGTPNSSGWAKWAGTSFSAAVISGLLARLIGANGVTTLADADNAIRAIPAVSVLSVGEVVPMHQL